MKKLILAMLMVLMCSTLQSKSVNQNTKQQKECFAFENKKVNIKLIKQDHYYINYKASKNNWVSVEVNWFNACKYSIKYLTKSISMFD